MNAFTFNNWLDNAQPGDRLTYFMGMLDVARDAGEKIVAAAYEAALAGRIHLVQRRIGNKGGFAYEAIRRGGK